MKKVTLLLAALVFGAASFAGSGEKQIYSINVEKSTIYWTGEKVTGEHTGTLMIKSGSIEVEDGTPVGANFIIDMNSIVCTDIEDAGTNKKLIGHLKSDDFFGVEKFPEGSFMATSFTPIKGASGRDANYTIKGKLTLKGKTQDIEFKAFISVDDSTLTSNGSAVFDRSEYDIRYGSGSFFDNLGDKTIYDDVSLTFVLSARK